MKKLIDVCKTNKRREMSNGHRTIFVVGTGYAASGEKLPIKLLVVFIRFECSFGNCLASMSSVSIF